MKWSKKTILRYIICLLALHPCGLLAANVEPASYQTDPFATLKGYKRVRVLTAKNGELLGYIYVKENYKYKNGVLSSLLVVKENGNKLDTLYRIDSKGFFNSHGKTELKNYVKVYYGFKLQKQPKKRNDFFSVGDVEKDGSMLSDDNDYMVDWNYKTKTFEYYPMP